MSNHSDTFEALAQRCERGADALDHEADNAAEILPTRAGGQQADPQEWAASKRDAARAAREYAAGLRAEAAAGRGPQARPDPDRLAQAERVAQAAELGGILIDGRPLAEHKADSGSVFDRPERELWEAGTHPTQEKARQIEATGEFTHVAETADGVAQVPFWQLGRADDESTVQRDDRRRDELSQQARDGRNAPDQATRTAWRDRDEAWTRSCAAPEHDSDEF